METVNNEKTLPRFADHGEQPRNNGPLKEFTGNARITGPCGDTMEFWVLVRGNRVEQASFTTDGCAHSLACGSMTTCLAEGKTLDEALKISRQSILDALQDLPGEGEHCALLSANTLHASLKDSVGRSHEPYAGEQKKKSACDSCSKSECSASSRRPGESDDDFENRRRLAERLCRIEHKIVVISGKGGVGKSTVAVNLAVSLMLSGNRVGLLDVDIHGPSVPTMLGLEGHNVRGENRELLPVEMENLKVLSIGFFLRSQDDAVIWRGPMKMTAIRQFLTDAAWGDLDYLIIDSPPGTGDEPLSVFQLMGDVDGALVVTTPQRVAAVDVRKSISFCHQLKVPVIGVVENMSGFVCPKCGEVTPIFRQGGGEMTAHDMGVPYLGSIPMDPLIAEACDSGRAFIRHYATSPTASIMREIIASVETGRKPADTPDDIRETAASGTDEKNQYHKEDASMRIAIPLADGRLCLHFGHCERFALVDVDTETKTITSREDLKPPQHEPGVLPRWLAEKGANIIIAGGMGQRAQSLFTENGIRVLVGAPSSTPEELAESFLAGTIELGENTCDH
jgi:Mrp family chromosome partitioning ATPase/predicted Fe-Mo cluster-binding NifX family protein